MTGLRPLLGTIQRLDWEIAFAISTDRLTGYKESQSPCTMSVRAWIVLT
jgi:hypothetical protein